ncbi:hypothetical protein Tco_0824841 [Tanacetum coccineum]
MIDASPTSSFSFRRFCVKYEKTSANLSPVNTPGSDENRLKLYDLMYIIVNGGCEDGGRWGGGDGVWLRAAAAADDEGVSNGDDDETKVMKDVMGMTMVVDS